MDTPPTILPREITYELSHHIHRAAARRYYFRRFLTPLIISCALTALCGAALAFDPRQDDIGGFGFALGWCAFLVYQYIRSYFRVYRVFEPLSGRHITARIEADSITWQTDEAVVTWKWTVIKRLWRLPDVLVLFPGEEGAGQLLPLAELGPEVGQAVEDKVREHGGWVA